MAVKDKLVNLEDLKVVGDAVGSLKSASVPVLGAPFNTYPGYFGADGSIATQGSTSLEVYTDKFHLEPGSKLQAVLSYSATKEMWLAYCTYDNTGYFISRTVLVPSQNKTYYSTTVTMPSNAYYIAFCYRTWDVATFTVMPFSDKYIGTVNDTTDNADTLMGITFTETPGYFDTSGNIAAQTANKEVYTSRITAYPGQKIKWNLHYASRRGMWIAYALYAVNGAFISRTTLVNGDLFTDKSGTLTLPDNACSIAFCYRTYDEATFTAFYQSFTDGIYNLRNDARYYNDGALENVITEVSNTYTAPSSGGQTLKLMAYNLAKYNDDTTTYIDTATGKLTNLKKLLYTESPDIVFTAEDSPTIDSGATKNAAQYIWNRMFASTSIDNDHPAFGTALHSRYAITGDGNCAISTYVARYGYVTVGDKTVFLIAVHLPVDTRAHRQAALSDIWALTQLATYDYLIIGGDFNTLTSDDRSDLVSWCSDHNLSMANGDFIGWVNTCNAYKALDNIVVSNNITIRGFRALENWYRDLYSDHYPVVAELVLT